MNNDFENLFENTLRKMRLACHNHTDSGHLPDFRIGQQLWVELKEKRQHINLRNWPIVNIPEDKLIILDELTVRKLTSIGVNSAVVFWDHTTDLYYAAMLFDILLQPRVRVNRPMETRSGNVVYKGKWMLNLLNWVVFDSIKDSVLFLLDAADNIHNHTGMISCYGDFAGEDVPVGGIIRTRELRSLDGHT